MRIAVYSDVHANIHALHAVLRDMNRRKLDAVVCLGDLVGYGTCPNEVIRMIRRLGFPSVMGNYDEGIGFDKEGCGCNYRDDESRRLGELSFAWTKQQVLDPNKEFLRSMRREYRLEIDGKRLLCVHGSPRKINEYLYENAPESKFEELATLAEADIIAFGHTHLPYVKQVFGVTFVNPGSVGDPRDGDPRACYALIEAENGAIGVHFVRVEYGPEEVDS